MTNSQLKAGIADLQSGFLNYHMWLFLAWQDIKKRYRRSVIGPFWITISTCCVITLMGPLYGVLLNQPVGPYVQYLAVSLIIWMFISTFINEACTTFIAAQTYILQIKLPLITHVLRVLSRGVFVLLHNLIIILVVLLIFPPESYSTIIFSFVGFVLVILNLFWIGLLLAILCTRFRDIPLIVGNLVVAAFFLSPILWKVDMLGRKAFLANFNPIYHFMELIRAPLFGSMPTMLTYVICISMLVIGSAITMVIFSRFRSRIAYWL